MNITPANQNSPSFGILKLPTHSSKVRLRENINCSQEILEYLEYLGGQNLIKKGFVVDKRSTNNTPVTLIMTKRGAKQDEIRETLEVLGAQEITPISKEIAKSILEDSKRLNIVNKDLNVGQLERGDYKRQLKAFLNFQI